METVGARLREARLARGMSIDDIAHVTKIPKASVTALEGWELHKLPAMVFVRGFIRAYASAVGLDGNALVRELREPGLQPGSTPEPAAAMDGLIATHSGRRGRDDGGVPAWLSLDEGPRSSGPGFRPGQALLLAVALGMVFAAWFMVGQRTTSDLETAQPGPPAIQEPVDGVSTFTDASR